MIHKSCPLSLLVLLKMKLISRILLTPVFSAGNMQITLQIDKQQGQYYLMFTFIIHSRFTVPLMWLSRIRKRGLNSATLVTGLCLVLQYFLEWDLAEIPDIAMDQRGAVSGKSKGRDPFF